MSLVWQTEKCYLQTLCGSGCGSGCSSSSSSSGSSGGGGGGGGVVSLFLMYK